MDEVQAAEATTASAGPSRTPAELAEMKQRYRPVLDCLQNDRLRTYCAQLRRKSQGFAGMMEHFSSQALPSVGEPEYGANNVVIPITFYDGLRWWLSIPVTGTEQDFSNRDAQKLLSAAETMDYLDLNTCMPVPAIHSYSDTVDSALGVPFIILQPLPGRPLDKMWYDYSDGHETLEHRRHNALKSIAEAWCQLEDFSFESSGRLDVDHERNELLIQDTDEEDYFTGHISPVDSQALKQTPAYLVELQKRHQFSRPDQHQVLLKYFLAWIPEVEDGRPTFVLAQPDTEMQNFLVDNEGYITALLDWSEVKTIPRALGYEALPSFIARGQDFAKYRQAFEAYMRAALNGFRMARTMGIGDLRSTMYWPSYTANSELLINLKQAACHPHLAEGVVDTIFEQLRPWLMLLLDERLELEKTNLLELGLEHLVGRGNAFDRSMFGIRGWDGDGDITEDGKYPRGVVNMLDDHTIAREELTVCIAAISLANDEMRLMTAIKQAFLALFRS